jgi:hypothetical protein
MANIITTTDLASYLRETALDTAAATLYVDLANGIVSEVLPDVVLPAPARVRAITLEVAARAYRNPNGYSSETIDDYTYRRDAETRQAGVYLTTSEREELHDFSGAAMTGAYSVDLGTPTP